MRPAHPSRSDPAAETRPRPAAAPASPRDAEWDEILLTAFGPRHWNLGCG